MLCLFGTVVAQKPTLVKNLPAKRTTQKVIIDGNLNEIAWKDAAKFDEMIEFRPTAGRKEEQGNHTEAYLMYTDEGIYFGGTCFERSKDSVSAELSGRDGFGTNDYIGLIFDTYNDKLNGFEYFLTPLGEQWDAKMSSNQNGNGEDFAWNAVWESKVVMHDKGWTFELFLPFAAIRFSKDKIQNWGLNITRRKRKTEQQYTWNPIDPNVNGFLTQEGLWTGVSDILPPVRLQLFPYFSVYQNHYPSGVPNQSGWSNQFSGGMDLKLGLNQAFTLDATLIPDFGQVQSDNNVLNLTPFEVKFNDYRAFFTEGTELFSKGDFFYSRRIGGSPLRQYDVYNDLKDNEEVISNPSESKLINASKISGRTKKGLGIGLLNAVTKSQNALIKNTETGEIRSYETDPTTNYNLLVIDQTLKNNSSISFVNTNVSRGNNNYDANVSAALFSFFDKKNTYNFNGKAAFSNLMYPEKENTLGYSHSIDFGKTSGRFMFNVRQDLTDTKFNSNDMGYFTNNNFIDNWLWFGYRYTEPKNWYNRLFFNVSGSYSTLFSPIGNIKTTFQSSQIRANMNAQTKKLVWIGGIVEYRPSQNDFYEPRQEGYFFKRGASTLVGIWIEGNSAKKYYINTELFTRQFFNFYNLTAYDLSLGQTYRFNSKFSINHQISYNPRPKGLGYTTTLSDGTILFAERNVKTVENTLFLKYNFTNKMGLTFRTRHYVSSVQNNKFHALQSDGSLMPYTHNENNHRNANFFNIDMVYTWQFAPGSFLNVVWKDASVTNSNQIGLGYGENFRNTLNADQNNNISMKIIYFIDYQTIRKAIRKRNA